MPKSQHVTVAIILGLIVIFGFFPTVFLGNTFNVSLNTSKIPTFDLLRDYGCQENCFGRMHHTIDPFADADAIWPVAKLIANTYSQGLIPLWNPYLAGGTPLAADSINFAFSPLIVFYLLPNSLWDIPLLVSVWLAGFFTYLLLRNWTLSSFSSLTGAVIFMLSGAIMWYLPHNSIPVIIFTPLILFSIEKTFQSRNFKYVVLGSTALAISILGGHLESIALLMVFCFVYALFRILYVVFSKSSKNIEQTSTDKIVNVLQSKKRLILKVTILFFAGLGLSAFYIIPAAEFILVTGTVGRDVSTGLTANPVFTIGTTFIPYFLGPLHNYTYQTFDYAAWNALGGYVVTSSLIFSLIGITFSNRLFQSSFNIRIAQFFFAISIFFMLKSIGIPIINMLGQLPVLEHVFFPRYDGFIYTLGFAITSAFGIEVVRQRNIDIKKLGTITILSILIIISMSLLSLPYFSWSENDPNTYYNIFQIFQALFFILVAFLLILSYQKNKSNLTAIFLLVFLEASLYIPFGLPPIWQFYRSIVVITGISILCVTCFIPLRIPNPNKTKMIIFIVIVAITIFANGIVYIQSPQGLPLRNDAFESTPTTDFLQNNLNNFRMFSFDEVYRPNHPVTNEIQILGILSAQNVKSFNSFFHEFLDPYAIGPHFNYVESWRLPNSQSIDFVFLENQKYYNFLGIKYILSTTSDPNAPLNYRGESKFVPIGSDSNDIQQNFVSLSPEIYGMAIWTGTYNRINHGDIILTLDSVPYNEIFHRDLILDANNILDGKLSYFEFNEPINNAKGVNFILNLSHPQATEQNGIAILTSGLNIDTTQDKIFGHLYKNGDLIKGSLVMSVVSERFLKVFTDGDINIYENKDVYPRSFLVNKFQMTDSYENAQNIIKNSDFDLRNKVILEEPLPAKWINLLESSTLDENSTSKIDLYSANKVIIKVNSKDAALLILTDTYYPGWKAYVDGEETEIYRADGLVRAIFIPQGSHLVEFSYMPQSFVTGLSISLLILIAFFGIIIFPNLIKKLRTKINNTN